MREAPATLRHRKGVISTERLVARGRFQAAQWAMIQFRCTWSNHYRYSCTDDQQVCAKWMPRMNLNACSTMADCSASPTRRLFNALAFVVRLSLCMFVYRPPYTPASLVQLVRFYTRRHACAMQLI